MSSSKGLMQELSNPNDRFLGGFATHEIFGQHEFQAAIYGFGLTPLGLRPVLRVPSDRRVWYAVDQMRLTVTRNKLRTGLARLISTATEQNRIQTALDVTGAAILRRNKRPPVHANGKSRTSETRKRNRSGCAQRGA